MAEEASRIGVSVDTVQAVNNIRNLAKEVRKTSKDVEVFDKFMNQLNPVLSSIASGFSLDVTSIKELNGTLKSAVTGINELNGSINSLTQGGVKLYSSFNKTSEVARGVSSSTNKANDSIRRMTKTLNDSAAQANRFNTGNIAAQFQDIFVTAQMGMKPLTIAMQQGTQLVYILQQSKNPLKDLTPAIKSLVAPLSLVTVGLTGLLAIFIQMVDWVKVGKDILNSLAKGFDFIAQYAREFAEGLTVLALVVSGSLLPAFGKMMFVLLGLSNTLVIATARAAAFWIALLGPIALIMGGIALMLTGFDELNVKLDDFDKKTEKSFTEKFIENVKKTINWIIIAFKNMVDAIAGYFDYLGKNLAYSLTSNMPNFIQKRIGVVPAMSWGNLVEDLNKKFEKNESTDFIGKMFPSLETNAEKAAEGLRKTANGLGESDKNAKKLEKTIEGLRNEYDELAISYQTKIDDIAFEKSTRGMTEEQKLVAEINHEYDQEIAKLERKVALKQIDVGLFAKEKSELDRLKEGYIESALEQERYNESVKNFNAVMDYSSSVTKGFFSDLKKGLKDGESAWESFTNAVVNMLDKIQDKIMDLAIDTMFNSLKQGNAASGSSNWLSGIINAGVSWVTGTEIMSGTKTDITSAAFASKAGVKPTMTANGGVFSNGIYSSPTVFQFAKGGKFGVMGEAGPEAVMPLRRGPDGSLGVKADGVGGSPVVVNVINNSNAQARTEQRQTAQGVEIDVLIDELVAEKLARPGTSSNGALRAFNNRQLVMR